MAYGIQLVLSRNHHLTIVANTPTVVFFGTELIYSSDVLYSNGRTTGLWDMGSLASTLAIFIVNLRMVIEIKYETIKIVFLRW